MGEREMVVVSHLGKTVGWGRSLKWSDWVHTTNFVSRWLDSGFEVTFYDRLLWLALQNADPISGHNPKFRSFLRNPDLCTIRGGGEEVIKCNRNKLDNLDWTEVTIVNSRRCNNKLLINKGTYIIAILKNR